MRTVAAVLLALFLTGCGSDKPDNSKIQSPSDQPLGVPQGMGGGKDGKSIQLGSPGGAGAGGTKGGTFEVKE